MIKGADVNINTPLGHQIGLTVFKPKSSNQKSIIISSATGVLQYYYSKFSVYFSELGYTVYTFDYSGIGKSNKNTSQLKSSIVDLKTWGENDQASVIDYAILQNTDHKLILITHSIGGQILAFNKNVSKIDTIITVASQSGYWKHWKGFERLKMITFWYVLIPVLTPLFGYFPAKKIGLFENLPKFMAYQWQRWGKHKDYILSEFKSDELQFKNFDRSMLALSFPNDEFASKSSVDWLANQFVNAKVDRQHIAPNDLNIDNVGHFGFFRKKFQDSLWNMINDWIINKV
ncbi:alpha/beta fold hydrolase [uncultured Winogradskyella sp.]|uniref:alpha/beta hydrolase family protein n=1 Tax=uncultured Winogradskyella sp. TaxID=395353 RepID=UPI00260CEB63|nr:alpha/beta fold hydrolase [uncultured Winogradskyella sp.]